MILLLACAPSEEALQAEWSAFLETHGACEQDQDCALVFPGCPLGCVAAVSREDVAQAEALAAELLERYGDRPCDYDCTILSQGASVAPLCEQEACASSLPRPARPRP